MKILRTILAAITLIAAVLTPIEASAQRGEKTLGVKAGYATRNSSGLAGIYFRYRFSRHVEIAPEIDYIFRNKGTDGFLFDIDVHFPFALGSGLVEVYPLVGVNYVSWNFRNDNDSENTDVTTRRSRFGLNAGAGIDFRVTSTLKLTLQARYNYVNKLDTGLFSAGIGYSF